MQKSVLPLPTRSKTHRAAGRPLDLAILAAHVTDNDLNQLFTYSVEFATLQQRMSRGGEARRWCNGFGSRVSCSTRVLGTLCGRHLGRDWDEFGRCMPRHGGPPRRDLAGALDAADAKFPQRNMSVLAQCTAAVAGGRRSHCRRGSQRLPRAQKMSPQRRSSDRWACNRCCVRAGGCGIQFPIATPAAGRAARRFSCARSRRRRSQGRRGASAGAWPRETPPAFNRGTLSGTRSGFQAIWFCAPCALARMDYSRERRARPHQRERPRLAADPWPILVVCGCQG